MYTSDPVIPTRPVTYLNAQPGSAAAVLSDICHTLDLRYGAPRTDSRSLADPLNESSR